MTILLTLAGLYVFIGFCYAGTNAMIDLNWAYRVYRTLVP